MPGGLAFRQALHADAPPTAIVDQLLQRFAQRVEEHLIDAFDQFPVAFQLDCVEVVGTFVQHGNPPLKLCCSNGEADRRRRLDDVVGQRIDEGEIPCTGIHQPVGDAAKAIGSRQLFKLIDEFRNSGQRGCESGSLAGAEPRMCVCTV